MKHIYRIDHAKSRTHSWFVTVQRRRRIYHRQFTDSVYGGKRNALDAAKMYRDGLLMSLAPLTRPEVCRIRKRNNRSGISGVTRIDTREKSRGRIARRRYWLAQWPIGEGRAKMKKYSIQRYGERGAFQRAVRARRQALKSLAKLAAPLSLQRALTCLNKYLWSFEDINEECLKRSTPRSVSLPGRKIKTSRGPTKTQ